MVKYKMKYKKGTLLLMSLFVVLFITTIVAIFYSYHHRYIKLLNEANENNKYIANNLEVSSIFYDNTFSLLKNYDITGSGGSASWQLEIDDILKPAERYSKNIDFGDIIREVEKSGNGFNVTYAVYNNTTGWIYNNGYAEITSGELSGYVGNSYDPSNDEIRSKVEVYISGYITQKINFLANYFKMELYSLSSPEIEHPYYSYPMGVDKKLKLNFSFTLKPKEGSFINKKVTFKFETEWDIDIERKGKATVSASYSGNTVTLTADPITLTYKINASIDKFEQKVKFEK